MTITTNWHIFMRNVRIFHFSDKKMQLSINLDTITCIRVFFFQASQHFYQEERLKEAAVLQVKINPSSIYIPSH